MIVWSSRKWRCIAAASCCVLVILAAVAWRILSLLRAEPTTKIDYLAEYNRVTKPADYDSNKNAAVHYEKLFSQFVPVPDILKNKDGVWPGELSPAEFEALKEWAGLNEPALEALHRAAQCPYWWVEARSRDGSLLGIELQYSNEQRECAWAVVLVAKYKASQGNIDGALQHLADLHMMGVHRARGDTLLQQLVGLAVCQLSYGAVLATLDRCDVGADTLNRIREVFASQLAQLEAPRFTRGEFLVALDCIQRAFSDDGHQDGRLIPKELYRIKKEPGFDSEPLSYTAAVWICLTHPGRKETLELYQGFYELLETLSRRHPSQLHAQSTTYERELVSFLDGNFFLQDDLGVFPMVIELGWRAKTQGEALVSVLAILTHRAQKGRLPDSLAELEAEARLPSVPIDPYSGKPLVYRVVADDFILYSVGEDFTDSGGVRSHWGRDGGDQVFWPVENGAGGL